MKIADLRAIIDTFSDDDDVFLVATSRNKEFDDVIAKEQLVVLEHGQWHKASKREPGKKALVFTAA